MYYILSYIYYFCIKHKTKVTVFQFKDLVETQVLMYYYNSLITFYVLEKILLNKTDPLILCVIICRLFTPTSIQPSYQYQQKTALWVKKGELQYLIHQVSI